VLKIAVHTYFCGQQPAVLNLVITRFVFRESVNRISRKVGVIGRGKWEVGACGRWHVACRREKTILTGLLDGKPEVKDDLKTQAEMWEIWERRDWV